VDTVGLSLCWHGPGFVLGTRYVYRPLVEGVEVRVHVHMGTTNG
jgi:hypothetical protein